MRKRKPTLEEAKLLAGIRKEQEAFDRWYTRANRAFTAMHKARVRLTRLKARLRKLETADATAC